MIQKLCLISFILFISFCDFKQGGPDYKQNIKTAFRLSFEKKYDSLSKFMPNRYFENISTDYQKLMFKPLRQAVKLGDIPSDLNLVTYPIHTYGENGFVVTFYPSKNLQSRDSTSYRNVDSICFYFTKSGGTNIAGFKTFMSFENIKTVQ